MGAVAVKTGGQNQPPSFQLPLTWRLWITTRGVNNHA
jgi:hypothetical protein